MSLVNEKSWAPIIWTLRVILLLSAVAAFLIILRIKENKEPESTRSYEHLLDSQVIAGAVVNQAMAQVIC